MTLPPILHVVRRRSGDSPSRRVCFFGIARAFVSGLLLRVRSLLIVLASPNDVLSVCPSLGRRFSLTGIRYSPLRRRGLYFGGKRHSLLATTQSVVLDEPLPLGGRARLQRSSVRTW